VRDIGAADYVGGRIRMGRAAKGERERKNGED
jgi:hypothetical protein